MPGLIEPRHFEAMLKLAEHVAEKAFRRFGVMKPVFLLSALVEGKLTKPDVVVLPAELCDNVGGAASRVIPVMLEDPEVDMVCFVNEVWMIERTEANPVTPEQTEAYLSAWRRCAISSTPS